MNKNEYIMVIILGLVYTTFQKAPMSLSLNQKFINTGTISADTSITYGNSSAQIWNPLQYNLTYPKSFGVVQVAQIFWSIKDFKVSLLEAYMHFYSRLISITTSAFTMAIYSNRTTIIQTLSYRYLLFINAYASSSANTMSYSLYNTAINNNVSSATNYTKTISVYTLNLTGGVQIHVTFIGFDVNTTTSDRAIDLTILGTYSSSTIVQLTITSKSSIPVYVGFVYISWFAYNKGYYNRSSFAAFSAASVSGSTFSITNVSNLYQKTTFLALNTLSIKANSFLDLKTSFNSPDSFTISTTNTNVNFSFTYILLFTYFCSYTSPYFYSNDGMCYDECPERMYGEIYNLSCSNCLIEGCIGCSNATTCIKCTQGYYLSSKGSCMSCPSNCPACSSNQSCSNDNSSSSNMALIVGIVIAIVVSGVIVAIVLYKLYKKTTTMQQNMLPNSVNLNQLSSDINLAQISIAIQPPPPQNPKAVLYPQSIIMVEVGIWHDRARQASVKQQCSFCYQEHSYLRLECSHYFHIKCIASWSEKNNTCPLCRKVFTESNHILICRLCRLKQKMMNFDDLIKAYNENKYEKQVLCPQCITISA